MLLESLNPISINNLIIFVIAVIGMVNIIVESKLMEPIRILAQLYVHPKIYSLMECYQCAGTWVGFLLGAAIISHNPILVFVCGMAGSYLASLNAVFVNYLEANSLIDVGEDV